MRSAGSRSSFSGRPARLEAELPAQLKPMHLHWKIPLESIGNERVPLAGRGVNWGSGKSPGADRPKRGRGRNAFLGLISLVLIAALILLLIAYFRRDDHDENSNAPVTRVPVTGAGAKARDRERAHDGATGLPYPVEGNVPLRPAVTTIVVSGLPAGAGRHERRALRRELRTVQAQIAEHHARDDAIAFGRTTRKGVKINAPVAAGDVSQTTWPAGRGSNTLASAIRQTSASVRGHRRRLIALVTPENVAIDRAAFGLRPRDRIVRIDPADGAHTRNGVARKLLTAFYGIRDQQTRMGAGR